MNAKQLEELNQNVSWSTYADDFPVKYIQAGEVDRQMQAALEMTSIPTFLEIGCGRAGSVVAQQLAKTGTTKIWFLDPYVEETPDFGTRLSWEQAAQQQFSVILCRSAFNYLSEDQLRTIRQMLAPGGRFIANTFLNPPGHEFSERLVETASGITLLEKFRLTEDNLIEHWLLRPDSTWSVQHFFHYYSANRIQALLPNVEIRQYNAASILIIFTNTEPR